MVGLSLNYWSYTQDPGIHTCVRVAIGNVHIIYSKMGIDQMPNFKTISNVKHDLSISLHCSGLFILSLFKPYSV